MYAALKAGAKIHGEPKERDSLSGYYSAAVIDFDGNSIEAVHRSGETFVASETGGPTIALLENGSVVSKSSKAGSIKAAESIAPPGSEAKSRAVSRAPTVINRAAPSVCSHRSQGPPPSYTVQTVQKSDDGSKAAKTIVGTLIGAAAGAAIAYAMVKGESQPSSSETATNPPPQYTPESHQLPAPSQFSQSDEQRQQATYRAIEAPPPRSVYTSASGPRSTLSRSVTSKNPRASTIYEGSEFFLDANGRRASDGSVFSIPEDLPLRAIEYPSPGNTSQHRHPCNPSTFISSYAADKPHNLAAPGSVHSASTIKASHASTYRRHSHDDRDRYSIYSHHTHSYRASSSSHSPSHHSTSKSQAKTPTDTGSTASSTRTARQIPLPAGSSSASYYSTHSAHPSHGGKSAVSAREIPLPDSVVDLDVNSHVTPDDSISQIGSGSGGRSTGHSHRTGHSKTGSRTSRHSSKSKFDDPVTPADSVSQVSRASQRTIKAGSGNGSRAPSKTSSRRGSQVV